MAAASKPLVLVADDDPVLLKAIDLRLREWGYRARTAENKADLFRRLDEEEPLLLLLDVCFGKDDGTELLSRLAQERPQLTVVMFTGRGSIDSAVNAIKLGAFDYLTKPVDWSRLRLAVDHALERQALRRRVERLEHLAAAPGAVRALRGESPATDHLRKLIAEVAPTDATVLIQGESGTGKELVARLLHDQSPRRNGPFVPVNMAALPRELVESTLFGHEKGSFTGATQGQVGCCEAADGGTLFLDEIGEMDLAIQAKLLRFLQEHTVQRVGSSKTRTVDVRIVAATNRDLRARVEAGHFREDLFYRLDVVPISVPPLRERKEDIGLLAGYFLERAAARYRKNLTGFSEDALRAMRAYHWPGNIRQLENLVERVAILNGGPELQLDDLPSELFGCGAGAAEPFAASASPRAVHPTPGMRVIDQQEKQLIADSLQKFGGNVRNAAKFLGLSPATVYRKIKSYGLAVAPDAGPAAGEPSELRGLGRDE